MKVLLVLLLPTLAGIPSLHNQADGHEPSQGSQSETALLHRRDELADKAKRCEAERKLDEAVTVAKEVLKLERQLYGDTHEEVAGTVGWLARLYFRQGDSETAKKAIRVALGILSELHSKGHWRVTDARFALDYYDRLAQIDAVTRREMAALEQRAEDAYAKKAYQECLASVEILRKQEERVLGSQHPYYASTLAWLGDCRTQLGQVDSAITLFRESLDIRTRSLGAEHPTTAQSLYDLGRLLASRGERAQAETLLCQCLAVRETAIGVDHLQVAYCCRQLGLLYQELEQYAKSETNYVRAVGIFERVPGHHSQSVYWSTLNNLGRLYAGMERWDDAEHAFRRSLEAHDNKAVWDKLQDVLQKRSEALQATNDFEAARRDLEEAKSILTRIYGERHYTVTDVRLKLSALTFLTGLDVPRRLELVHATDLLVPLQRLENEWRVVEAIPVATRVVEIRRRLLGDGHRDTVASLRRLARLYEASAEYVNAEPLLREIVRTCETLLGKEHPDTAKSQSELGALYKSVGDYTRAGPLCERSYATLRNVLGDEHPDTIMALSRLVLLCSAIGQNEKARRLLELVWSAHPPYAPFQAEFAVWMSQPALFGGFLGAVQTTRLVLLQKLWLETYAELRSRGGDDPIETATQSHNFAYMDFLRGDYSHVEKDFKDALETMRRHLGSEHPKVVGILDNLASLYDFTGDQTKALSYFRESVEATQKYVRLTAAAQSERQQLAMTRLLRVRLDRCLSLCVRSGAFSERDYEKVLAWKGVVTQRQRERRLLLDSPELGPVFDELRAVTSRLSSIALTTPSSEKLEVWRRQVAELNEEKERLESQVSARSTHEQGTQEPATLEELRTSLPGECVLIDFLEIDWFSPPERQAAGGLGEHRAEGNLGPAPSAGFGLLAEPSAEGGRRNPALPTGRHLLAFVVRGEQPVHVLDLGPVQPISKAVDGWRRTFGCTTEGEVAGRFLYDSIWAPLKAHVRNARVVLLSPDGVLGRLPIGALPDKESNGFLLEKWAIVFLPTPGILPSLIKKSRQRETRNRALLVGDVDYDGPCVRAPGGASTASFVVKKRAIRWEGRQFSRLAGTAGEIASIGRTYYRSVGGEGVTTLDRAKATEEAFRREAARHVYLHVATHGFFSPAELRSTLLRPNVEAGQLAGTSSVVECAPALNPGLLSGLVFAGANSVPQVTTASAALSETDFDDGLLTAEEVATLDLRGVDLAVLSACETGLGEVAGGEGLLGLQRAFHVAGARSVVASLWRVDDQATRVFMERFYDNYWNKRMGKLEAIREAQLWMRKEGGPTGGVRALVPLDADEATADGGLSPYYWAAFVLSGDWR